MCGGEKGGSGFRKVATKKQQYQAKYPERAAVPGKVSKMFPPLFPGKGRSAMRGGEEEKAVKRRKDEVKMLQCTL